jgi:hypothetical protein
VGVGALGVLGAALEPDENRRFTRIVARLVTLAKNVEALRSTMGAPWLGSSESPLPKVSASGVDTSLSG